MFCSLSHQYPNAIQSHTNQFTQKHMKQSPKHRSSDPNERGTLRLQLQHNRTREPQHLKNTAKQSKYYGSKNEPKQAKQSKGVLVISAVFHRYYGSKNEPKQAEQSKGVLVISAVFHWYYGSKNEPKQAKQSKAKQSKARVS